MNLKTATLWTIFAMIFVLAGCPKKDTTQTGTEEPTTPTTETGEGTEPTEPPEEVIPETPPEPTVTALEDTREATWGGKLATMDLIKWVAAMQKEGETTSILVFKPAGDGAMWAKATTEGFYQLGEEGILVTEAGAKKVVEYEAVPADVFAILKATIEKTPIPKKATTEGEGLLTIQVSSEPALVMAHLKGTLSPEVKAAAKPPKKGKVSKDLGAMAQKIAEAYIMVHTTPPPEEGGEEGGEE
jgi:hypothetical protein